MQAFARQLVAYLEGWDALLTPALAERPLALGTLDPAAPEPLSTFTRSGLFTPFTPIFNATGQPAIALPLFEGQEGLPLAVQLVGRPAREDVLLSVAGELEEGTAWAARRPRLALDQDSSIERPRAARRPARSTRSGASSRSASVLPFRLRRALGLSPRPRRSTSRAA